MESNWKVTFKRFTSSICVPVSLDDPQASLSLLLRSFDEETCLCETCGAVLLPAKRNKHRLHFAAYLWDLRWMIAQRVREMHCGSAQCHRFLLLLLLLHCGDNVSEVHTLGNNAHLPPPHCQTETMRWFAASLSSVSLHFRWLHYVSGIVFCIKMWKTETQLQLEPPSLMDWVLHCIQLMHFQVSYC